LVALARTLLQAAPVTILDEPSAGLDEATERRAIAGIHKAIAHRSLVVISHRPAVAAFSLRVASMERGKIARLSQREAPPPQPKGGGS
jgi:ATP-binding cassette subfamily C protein LapB